MASRQISRHPSNASRTHLHPRDAEGESAHKKINKKKTDHKTTSHAGDNDISTSQRPTLQHSWAFGGALHDVQDEPEPRPESPQKSDDSWNALNYLDPEQDATGGVIQDSVERWITQTETGMLEARIRLERQHSRNTNRDPVRGQAEQGPVDLRIGSRQSMDGSVVAYPNENDLLNQPVFLQTLVPAGSTWSSLVGSGDEAAAWCSWRSPTEPLSEQKLVTSP